MAKMMEYKCPCCNGAIAFNSTLQKMKCPYCDTEFEMETLAGYDEDLKKDAPDEMEWDDDTTKEWKDAEEEGVQIFSCQSCGGEIIGDASTAATKCPYCDNPVVIKSRFSGVLKPDIIIPFKLDKKAAKEAYLKHVSKKPLLPKVFKDQNHIDEIKGIYVPFWIFDANADADIRFKATTTRFWSDSNYNYTQTSYYSVTRSGTLDFKAVPADGSSKIPDDITQSLEPFNISEGVDFQTAYLAGYFADKYDVDSQSCQEIANRRIKRSTEDSFKSTVTGYSSVIPESSSVKFNSAKTRYALYPVWFLNTTWKDEHFLFAMNGQTGKIVGNLPMDKGALGRILGGIIGGGTILLTLMQFLIWRIF